MISERCDNPLAVIGLDRDPNSRSVAHDRWSSGRRRRSSKPQPDHLIALHDDGRPRLAVVARHDDQDDIAAPQSFLPSSSSSSAARSRKSRLDELVAFLGARVVAKELRVLLQPPQELRIIPIRHPKRHLAQALRTLALAVIRPSCARRSWPCRLSVRIGNRLPAGRSGQASVTGRLSRTSAHRPRIPAIDLSSGRRWAWLAQSR